MPYHLWSKETAISVTLITDVQKDELLEREEGEGTAGRVEIWRQAAKKKGTMTTLSMRVQEKRKPETKGYAKSNSARMQHIMSG